MSQIETNTPTLLEALKGLSEHHRNISPSKHLEDLVRVYDSDGTFVEFWANKQDGFVLAQLEYLLVKLASEWGVRTPRVNHIVGEFGSADTVSVYGNRYVIGQEGITSNAHALAVGLLRFKEKP